MNEFDSALVDLQKKTRMNAALAAAVAVEINSKSDSSITGNSKNSR